MNMKKKLMEEQRKVRSGKYELQETYFVDKSSTFYSRGKKDPELKLKSFRIEHRIKWSDGGRMAFADCLCLIGS